MTISCYHCDGTGYIYNGTGSTLDEDNYDICEECGGYGLLEDSEYVED